MEVVFASCKQRLIHRKFLHLCTQNRKLVRNIHLSALPFELNKPCSGSTSDSVSCIASCKQRRNFLHLCTQNRKLVRNIHLSALLFELNKPRPNEEDSPITPSPPITESEIPYEMLKVKGHTTEHSRGSVSERGKEKEEEEEGEADLSWKKLPNIYLKLSKSRLTMLVVLTAMGGYGMAPAPLDPSVLLWTAAGTGLCSAAANTFNQWIEVPYDAMMTRTKNRVLVRNKISPNHALTFGIASGVGGALILWQLVNPLTASLGVANVLLYAGLYTPLKRVGIINTWVGSVVGAIPPLMGWTACTGTLDSGAIVLAGILYAWQFAHFNALSWGLKGDYSRAGYRMMSVTHPALCKRVALRYSVATIPICALAPMCDLTTWLFALDSLPVNLWLVFLAWRFYRDSDSKSARRLFQYSLLHLPILMALLLINKKHWYGRDVEEREEECQGDVGHGQGAQDKVGPPSQGENVDLQGDIGQYQEGGLR